MATLAPVSWELFIFYLGGQASVCSLLPVIGVSVAVGVALSEEIGARPLQVMAAEPEPTVCILSPAT